MKKSLILLLAILLVAMVLPGCSGSKDEGGAVKLGLGIVTSISKSRDMNVENNVMAQAQVDTTIAAVTFDKDGKIVSVQIDAAQTRVLYDADLKVASDKTAVVQTKKERGSAYNMLPRSEIGKEWFEQIAALEAWMIGKTVAEVKAMPVKVVDDAHQNVPDVEELTSSVTITVESYIAAVEAAWNNTVEVSKVDKMGLGISTKISSSRDMNVENNVLARAQVDTTIAATAFDKDGKVIATLIDSAQTRVEYDADGKVTSDKTAVVQTKKERGSAYNMLPRSEIGKEWFEQIGALEAWMVGQTVAEIKALPVKVVDATHQHVPDIEELTSSVTITVESYLYALDKSWTNAN